MPLHTDVCLHGIETSQHVAAEITLLPAGRCDKSSLVENLATGILRPIEIQRHSRIYVRTGREGDARSRGNGANNVNGGADLAKTKPSSDQPPKMARTALRDPREGRS